MDLDIIFLEWDLLGMKGHKIMILIRVFRVFLKLKIHILDGCLQSADQGDDNNTLKAITLNFGLVNLNPAGTITPDQLPDTIKQWDSQQRKFREKFYHEAYFGNLTWTA
jgi:hypothetical protein